MNKITVLERPHYQPTYRIQPATIASGISSPYTSRFGILRDASEITETSWESFGVDSLSAYFASGMQMLHNNLGHLEDLLQTYSEADGKNLLFMVESLIQARHLIDDVQFPVK